MWVKFDNEYSSQAHSMVRVHAEIKTLKNVKRILTNATIRFYKWCKAFLYKNINSKLWIHYINDN